MNEAMLRNIVVSSYLVRGKKTHSLSIESRAGRVWANSIFNPIENRSMRVIIHGYKIAINA
jgi:hypothetical protein